MKKSKLAIGLMTAMMSVGVLAGCDNVVKYSSDGVILTYVDGDGNKQEVTADDIFVDYYSDSNKYKEIFDRIYSILVRNYFTKTEEIWDYQGKHLEHPIELGSKQQPGIEIEAQSKVDSDIKDAKTNAANSNNSYKQEFEAILTEKGVETQEELFDKYVEELQKEKFDENFYEYHMDLIKNGSDEVDGFWTGYFDDMIPYHVSHILVKLDDSTGTNYSNGTISEDNAKRLVSVINSLKDGEDSFAKITENNKKYGGDEGSAENGGDLGIMDYSTGYVNEFKLGVYAYENFSGKNADTVKASKIALPEIEELDNSKGIAYDFKEVSAQSFDDNDASDTVATIPYSVFEELEEYAEIDKDERNKAVLDDNAVFYPRNIIYNKYLNRHSVAFITNETTETGNATKESANQKDGFTGFHKYTEAENKALFDLGKSVLSLKVAGEWTPILAVRAGSGNYQGIHLIVVNRSPFDTEVDGVSLNDYYTTYYPEQDGYPEVGGKKTYVTFYTDDEKETKSRAESFISTVKNYDSDKLQKFIYKKYSKDQGIEFSDKDLEKALNTWIERSLEKTKEETKDSWEKTWNEYIDVLRKQYSERQKLISQACKIGYTKANSKDSINDFIDEMAQAMVDAKEFASLEEAKAAIKKTKYDEAVTTVAELFKLEGALCNDGKEY